MPTKATNIIVQSPEAPVRSDSFLDWIARHWLAWFTALTGMWVTLPWLAPMLMHAGATWPAYLIYLLYSPQCHQLPQRSYFLFGDRLMVPLADILSVTGPSDPLELRWFVGAPDLGWKVAWSDRMVSLYTPLFLGAATYAICGRCWRPLRWRWALLLPYLPLLIDGLSHLVDDTFRLGIRADNAWLAAVTGNLFTQAFYTGDALGSFNWWARLLTGLLASAAFVRQVYPLLDRGFASLARHERPIQDVRG